MRALSVEPWVLDSLSRLTVELTKLRQIECRHLAVENVGPEIFGKLLAEYLGERDAI